MCICADFFTKHNSEMKKRVISSFFPGKVTLESLRRKNFHFSPVAAKVYNVQFLNRIRTEIEKLSGKIRMAFEVIAP